LCLLLGWPSTAAAQRFSSAAGGAIDVPPLLRAIDVPALASDGLSLNPPIDRLGDAESGRGGAAGGAAGSVRGCHRSSSGV
jgi:hypothetical protein